MAKEVLSDLEVEEEIKRLEQSENVILYRKYNYLMNRRRQRLYTLRHREKAGKQLAEQGYTLENIEQMLAAIEDDAE